jgi:ABC-2 type transport system permease protein
MGKVFAMAIKDLRLLLRDKTGFFFTFFFPLIMAVFFGAMFSGGGGGSGISILLVDEDGTAKSSEFVTLLQEAPELKVTISEREDAVSRVRRGKSTAYIVLKKGFGDAYGRAFGGDPPEIELGVDPARKAEAGLLQGVLAQYAAKRFEKLIASSGGNLSPITIDQRQVTVQRAGPNNAFAISFPQGIIWGIIGCAAAFGISLVVERTGGTLVRLRMSPLHRSQILAGKALACFLTTMGVAILLLTVAVVVFKVRPNSLPFLGMAVLSSALGFVGIMMFLSVLGKTEQSAGGIGWAVLLVMAMTGGGMIPLFAMPPWMLNVSHFSPIKWSILAMEGAIWRQFSFVEMMLPCGILLGVGVVFFFIGARVFRWTEQS